MPTARTAANFFIVNTSWSLMLDSLKVSTLHKAESYITLMLSGAYV